MGKTVYVRVGGSFVWPPMQYLVKSGGRLPGRVVCIAGGVGIKLVP
jgi:hypothetical protein